jgi:hypothetical protein
MMAVSVQRSNVSKSKGELRMSKRIFCFALCAMLFALCSSVEAQQPKKIPRIGYLSNIDSASESTRSEGVRLALRELGYIEGQNIAIEMRRGRSIGSLSLWPSWCVSRLMSSW